MEIESKKTIQEHIRLSDAELFRLIAKDVRESEERILHSEGEDDAEGHQILLKAIQIVRERICTRTDIQELLDRKKDDIELTITVAGTLFDPYGVITASLIAILICRRGLKAICTGVPPNEELE